MKKPVVIIGVGEMGGVFARGFLRLGHPVYPVLRSHDLQQVSEDIGDVEAVLIAVGEKDLQPRLAQLPTIWKEKVILLQNELLPADFAQLSQVTVISVWFEKKPGMDYKVIIPSPCYGPKAKLVGKALHTLEIPVKILTNEDELLFELVLKNLYILTTNIAGLQTGGTVEQLWKEHHVLANKVADDIITLQQALTGRKLDRDALIRGMCQAFDGDPDHNCKGRSAPARLQRALEHARQNDLDLPGLQQLAAEMH